MIQMEYTVDTLEVGSTKELTAKELYPEMLIDIYISIEYYVNTIYIFRLERIPLFLNF